MERVVFGQGVVGGLSVQYGRGGGGLAPSNQPHNGGGRQAGRSALCLSVPRSSLPGSHSIPLYNLGHMCPESTVNILSNFLSNYLFFT